MNILFFMNHYPDSRNGGIENVTRMLSERFVEKGNIVDVAFLSKSPYDYSDVFIFRNVKQLKKSTIEKEISTWVDEGQIDVIINRSVTFATPILRRACRDKCKIVTTYNNKPILNPPTIKELWSNNKTPFVKKFISTLLYPLFCHRSKTRLRSRHQDSYRDSDKTILLSSQYVPEYTKMMGVASQKINVKNNPIRDNLRISEEDILHKKKEILMVTRLDETQKCVIKALEIWRLIYPRHLDWTLKIIGSGQDELKIKNYAKKHSLANVTFIPACKPDIYYKNSSIFLMTSRNEGWPNTINEAMRMGCVPVVIATFSAVFDMIDNGVNGMLIPDNDKSTLKCCEVLDTLMYNCGKRIKMARNAIIKSDRLSIHTITEEWITLLRNL